MSKKYVFDRNQKAASSYTQAFNRKFANALGLDQKHCTNEEYELAKQHCIYPADHLQIKSEDGRVVWDLEAFSFFEQEEAPDTVNPSLWMNGKSNYLAGVFEVVKDAIYQVRGFDIANLTIIRGKKGWIVQDVMTNIETSRAALELLGKALNEDIINNVSAIIISHSHGDHFGGIRGVVSPEQVGRAEDGKIPIYVPAGFDIECVKENVFAGYAMGRRAHFQFGHGIEPGPKGLVSTGLGLASPKGESSFINPTDYIDENKTVIIDGITVEFQLTPGTEAPSEMNNYFADYRALWLAENCCGTLHNLYPIRGAQLRDSSAWTDYILEAMVKYADKSDVIFQSHNWPHFNTGENPNVIRDYLLGNAAIYKHTHDLTLFFANRGLTAKEIARRIHMPKGLQKNWYARPYYGSLPINARAVYTKYLGFFNGSPNDIDPLTEVEQAKTFVEYAGPAETILEKAKEQMEAGDYRNAAYAAGNVVLADPENEEARLLCADAWEQLGYIAESSVWRNAYLQGARELRYGKDKTLAAKKHNQDMEHCMSVELMLKYLGIAFDNEAAEEEDFAVTFYIREEASQPEQAYAIVVKSGVILAYPDEDKTIRSYAHLTKRELSALVDKRLDEVRNQIETNDYELLKKIESYLVRFADYQNFDMIRSADV